MCITYMRCNEATVHLALSARLPYQSENRFRAPVIVTLIIDC